MSGDRGSLKLLAPTVSPTASPSTAPVPTTHMPSFSPTAAPEDIGDTAETATVLSGIPFSVISNINGISDEDVFAIDLAAGTEYYISLDFIYRAGHLDMSLHRVTSVYDLLTYANRVASSTGYYGKRIDYSPSIGARYYIRVYGRYGGTGEYTLSSLIIPPTPYPTPYPTPIIPTHSPTITRSPSTVVKFNEPFLDLLSSYFLV